MSWGLGNVGGGGLSNAFAIIVATYPSGSECICTNGSRTLRAKGDSGKYLFLIPSAGTWEVKCTDRDHPSGVSSDPIPIENQYQIEYVTLKYPLYLFKTGSGVASGYNCIAKTYPGKAGFSIKSDKITTLNSVDYYNIFYFTPSVDFEAYTKLYVDIECVSKYEGYGFNIIVGTDVPTNYYSPGNIKAQVKNHFSTSRIAVPLSVSGQSSSLYVKFDSTGCIAYIYNIWLE